MAKLKKQVLGEVSGTLGTFVFREIKGKNVIGMRPSNVSVANDPASVDRRNKFKMSSKLAQAVLADPNLKKIWAAKTPYELNTHNYIVQQNYNSTLPDSLSDVIKLIPEFGFPLIVSSVNKTSSQLSVSLTALNSNPGFKHLDETNIMMITILFLSNPIDSSVPDYSFLTLFAPSQAINLTNPLTFNAELDGPSGVVYGKYSEQKMFFVFLTLDENDNVIQFSNTFVG